MSIRGTVLIVDDEQVQLKILGKIVDDMGYNYIAMNNGLEVVDFFVNKKIINGFSSKDIDVMLLDLSMPDLDGIMVLKQICHVKNNLQVIVFTADGGHKSVVEAVNNGAIDYVIKGQEDALSRISISVENAIERKNLRYQVSYLNRKTKNQVKFSDIIANGKLMSDVVSVAKKVANSNISVLLQGPSGSGKESLARAIHGSSPRSNKPFVVVDCDLLKKDDVELELFGSDKILEDGKIKHIGKIREADGGTIFFDKIHTIKPEIQLKLLSCFREEEFVPLGGRNPIKINVRTMFSSSIDLKDMMKRRKFREDLYYRISGFPIIVPSLNEREKEDIAALIKSFIKDFNSSENKKIKGINHEALCMIMAYKWEDNVRQLRNAIFQAFILCETETLNKSCFPQLIEKTVDGQIDKSKSIIKKGSGIETMIVDIYDDQGICKKMEMIEEEIIRKLIDKYYGNVSEVAKILNIGRSTIYRRINTMYNTQYYEKD